jgi:hypothetical protein
VVDRIGQVRVASPERMGPNAGPEVPDERSAARAQHAASYSDDQLTLLLELLDRFRTLIAEHTTTLRARAASNQPTTPRG